ncbi:energy transducer TonB [Flavobacterium sp. SM15]|uniref:energy transducer TonB n=1 Tax=Flavobacterium sp. SM15 TaxID=2908005 RepID=UPI001EDB7E8A|nr:energy transducer TonB [Flavobacterium sp. SM15]MCG2609889.1 energy transducer TonB [Flavobacterium sp. SM15]
MFKKSALVVFLLLLCNSVFSQIGGEDEVYLDGDKVEAKFQGGDLNKFADFVFTNLDKTKIEKEGQLICAFSINELGELKNIRIVKDLGGDSALEMIRVLRLSPKWQPATRNGKPFSTTYKIPFTFKRAQQNLNQEKQQSVVSNEKDNEGADEKIYVAVEKPAKFPGGDSAFRDYFMKNFTNPTKIKNELRIMATFIVDKEGSLSNVELLRISDNSRLLVDEVVKLLSNGPKWIPAMQNGKKVKMKSTLAITLIIN